MNCRVDIFFFQEKLYIMPDEIKEFRLSVSKTKCYSDCAKKYYFSYVLKLPKKEKDYFIFGKFLHQILEDFHAEYINGSVEATHKVMAKVYKNALIEYKPKMTTEALKEAYDIADSYLQKISSEKKPTSNIVAVEKEFSFNISDTIILNGMIDRIQIDDDDVLHLADYKTTKNKKYLKNDWFQLMTYGFVMLNENPDIKKIRGSYILLRHNFEYITKEFSANELLAVKQQYIDYAKSIEEEKLWRPNPTKLCLFCDYIDKCTEGNAFINKGKNTTHGEMQW